MPRLRVVVTMLLGAALTVLPLAGAGTAGAHATLIATDPADDAVLTEPAQRVSATFSEPMQSDFAAMTVVGPEGDQWTTGDAQVEGAVISTAVRPLGPSGTYTVNYRATSADGHVVTGSWSFQLEVSGPGTAAPTVAPGDPTADQAPADTTAAAPGDDPPVWPFVALAAAIVAAGVWWQMRRR